MQTFEAKYPGTCGASCGTRIQVGEEVIFDTSGGLIHADCMAKSDPNRPALTCKECFIEVPCACCD